MHIPYSPVLPLVAVAVNCVCQVLMVRARKGIGFLQSVIEGIFWGLLTLMLGQSLITYFSGFNAHDLFVFFLVNIPIYFSLSYCYFGLINLGHTSIRIRLYAEISEAREGVPMVRIQSIYDEASFAKLRLSRRLESGDLIEKNGVLTVGKSRLVHASSFLSCIRLIIFGRKYEFDRNQI